MSEPTSTPSPEGSPYQPPSSESAASPGGGYGPAPGYYEPASTTGRPGDLFPRFLARVIDNILVGIVSAIISAIVGAIIGTSVGYGYSIGASYAASAAGGIIGAVIALGYFALMESRKGQTVGKMALSLRTEGPDGNPPSLEVAIRRNFWVALGILAVVPFVGGLIGALAELVIVILIAVTVSNSPTKQGWHDGFAGGTRVVRTK